MYILPAKEKRFTLKISTNEKVNDRRELTFLIINQQTIMSTKLLSETICRKGLMVKCFVALIVFCCSVGEAFAQTDTKVTINVNNVLIRTALDQLQREAKIHLFTMKKILIQENG